MHDTHVIEVHSEVRPEDDIAIRQGLDRFNHSAGPFTEVRPLRCFARAASGTLIGGVVGQSWGACSELGQIGVEESHRRMGLGSELIQRFEAEVTARGCALVYLDTFSFNGPEFYFDHGYEIAC